MARLTPIGFLNSIPWWGDCEQDDVLVWDESLGRFRRRQTSALNDHTHSQYAAADHTHAAYAAVGHNHSGWDDLRIVPSAFDFAGNADPAQTTWQPGGSGATFRVWEFAPSDEAFFTCQLPHGYKEGSALKAHIHWTPADRGTAENTKTVAWKLDVSAASVNGAFGASATVDLTDACTGTNDKHEMTPSGAVSGVGLTVSAMLVCRIYRDAGDTWATNTPGSLPILLEVDFHYEFDTVGSSQETQK